MSQLRPISFGAGSRHLEALRARAQPLEVMELSFGSSNLIMFDPADDGADPGTKLLTAPIKPGRYKILTKIYEPDDLTSLVLHRFDGVS